MRTSRPAQNNSGAGFGPRFRFKWRECYDHFSHPSSVAALRRMTSRNKYESKRFSFRVSFLNFANGKKIRRQIARHAKMREFLKCECPHCGQSIEYPAEGTGQTVLCPTCKKYFVLSPENAPTISGSIVIPPVPVQAKPKEGKPVRTNLSKLTEEKKILTVGRLAKRLNSSIFQKNQNGL